MLSTTIRNRNMVAFYERYHVKNLTWHLKDSAWKAAQVLKMMQRHKLDPATIVEVGCGAGEILNQLHHKMEGRDIEFEGYDIAYKAIEICQPKVKDGLNYYWGDFFKEPGTRDLLLVPDVFEHVENYIDFIRKCGRKSEYKIYHIPLELSVMSILRNRFSAARAQVGHLHFFNKQIALEAIKGTGQEIIDCFYTEGAFHNNTKLRTKLLNVPRRVTGAFSKELSSTLFGGYSLMVLAR